MFTQFKDLSHNIRTLRKQNNYTQQELAEKANVSVSTIRRLEQMSDNITLATFLGIANVLKVSPEELLKPQK